MTTLVLMRHCKAQRFSRRGDYNRELTEAGQNQAKEAALKLHTQVDKIDQALVSAATRARQSAVPALVELDAEHISYLPRIYDADEWELLDILRGYGVGECVLVVGHQPTISATANLLVGQGEAPINAPTGTVLILEFEGKWAELQPGAAHLENRIITQVRD